MLNRNLPPPPRRLAADAERRANQALHENLSSVPRAAPAAPAEAHQRRTPKRRLLPPPSRSRLYARVSDALERDARLSATAIKVGLWLVKWARGRHQVDGFVEQIADAIGRKKRMVQYGQAELERCGYVRIERVRDGRLNDANIYHLLAPLVAPPAERRRLPIRGAARSSMGVQNLAPHEGGILPTSSSSPGAARAGDEKAGASRAEVGRPGAPGRNLRRYRARRRERGSPGGEWSENRALPEAPSATGPP